MLENYIIYLIMLIVMVWGAVVIKYCYENKQYKESAYGKQSKKSFLKIINDQGARGEYRTSQILETATFENKLLFNCYIPNRSGDKTELDIIMISTKGIYVIENKNYSGWIFGDEQSKNWCETLKGKKFFFYNPVKQNKSHIKNLEKILNIGQDKYISLITFNGNANLKKVNTESPNLYVKSYAQLKKFIKEQEKQTNLLHHEEIEQIYLTLLPGTQLSDQEKQEHINRIKKQYKKN
nr:nuclease-related domain-containing protein [uncultured Blautia sp.]